jgi:hypothetical protein
MKRIILLVTIFLSAISVLEAKSGVHFRIFGGYNSSDLNFDFKEQANIIKNTKSNYHLGASFRFEMGKTFYLEPELYITRKGGDINAMLGADSVSQFGDYQSVDVPILFGFRLFDNDDFKIRLYAGPVLSFLQDKTIYAYKNGTLAEVQDYLRIFSAQAGFGLDIFFITLDVKYEIGLSNVSSFDDVATKANVFYVTLGIKLF